MDPADLDDLAPEAPTFAILRAPKAPDDAYALADLLCTGSDATARIVETFEAWLGAEAAVLVVRGGSDGGAWSTTTFDERDLERLRSRRVLGIGRAAGRLLGAVGLPVDVATAHFGLEVASAQRCASAVTPSGPHALAFTTHLPSPPDAMAAGLHGGDEDMNQAVFLPESSYEARVVEPLLRWRESGLYAPAVRRHHHAWFGVALPVARWTRPYAELVREVAHALALLPIEPLRLPWPALAEAGVYSLDLAGAGSPEAANRACFFLCPAGPVRLRATLESPSPQAPTLKFYAPVDLPVDARVERVGPHAQRLECVLLVGPLAANPARVWELDVTNFGSSPLSGVRLTLEVDEDPTLSLPSGEVVSLRTPVADEGLLARLVEAYLAAGPELGSEIAQLLAASPGQAACHLRGALRSVGDAARWTELWLLFQHVKQSRLRPRAPWPREPWT